MSFQDTDDLVLLSQLLPKLNTVIRWRAFYYDSLPTTQDEALRLAEAGFPEGTLVIANQMTAGRGRMSRQWLAPPGGLWFTAILRPPPISQPHLVNLAAAIAVARSVKDLFGVDAKLKWPNDVIVDSRKLCGILSELHVSGGSFVILLGVGINVNNDIPDEIKHTATSLRSLLGHRVGRLPLLLSFIKFFDSDYTLIKKGYTDLIISSYQALCTTIGRRVEVTTPTGSYIGVAVGVDSMGRLIVRTPSGAQILFSAGEVLHVEG